MTIHQVDSLLHWNYFLALENDLGVCSRYVEFNDANNDVFSIEFAHILFASSSEVDVVAKELCKLINPSSRASKIGTYFPIITDRFPDFLEQTVFINKYGLNFQPWINWTSTETPFWWQSYNKVKHQRNDYFSRANFKNALNNMGALLIITIYYYAMKFGVELLSEDDFLHTTMELRPRSNLLRLNGDYYLGSQFD
ncbi:hypothetical protein SDC9_86803 [bioreactor metagenome]|uniref:Uncharacterized protein n=1 Tax=bioreactor metagenome TaxID=1076179 RepID=A0A644ZN91_9ZZZZ